MIRRMHILAMIIGSDAGIMILGAVIRIILRIGMGIIRGIDMRMIIGSVVRVVIIIKGIVVGIVMKSLCRDYYGNTTWVVIAIDYRECYSQ